MISGHDLGRASLVKIYMSPMADTRFQESQSSPVVLVML
jgi:hypothetical protein